MAPASSVAGGCSLLLYSVRGSELATAADRPTRKMSAACGQGTFRGPEVRTYYRRRLSAVPISVRGVRPDIPCTIQLAIGGIPNCLVQL